MIRRRSKTKSLADKLFPITSDLDDLGILEIPPEKRKLHTETYDFTVGTVHDYLESGEIYIPEFQRSYV